jgi:tRNA(fMet)-specific endonuclease VapC
VTEARFLLDSNILIYLLEGTSAAARQRVEKCRPGEIGTSSVAYAEVMRKTPLDDAAKSADVEALFAVVKVVPFDQAAALAYARIPFKRGGFDRLIAAHALSLDLTFVTNNERHFIGVEALRVENWTMK